MIETTRDLAPIGARSAITARGTAALRLAEFEDQWRELTHADRAWFTAWLTELLVDACQEVPA